MPFRIYKSLPASAQQITFKSSIQTMSSASPSPSSRLLDLTHPIVAGLISVIVNYGGAFILALGLSGWFDRLIRLIPPGVAAGLLAGILLQFGIQAFGGMGIDPVLAGLLIATYVVLKRLSARYAVVGILVLGLLFLLMQDRVDLSGLSLRLAAPVFTMPAFSLNALLSVALPLFLITLTGQYMPGMLVLRNDGFKTSANPIVA